MTKHPVVTRTCARCEKSFDSTREEQYWCPACTREYDRLRRQHKGETVLRETKITFLPSCGVCRNYPAQEVAPKVYRCTECQREDAWQLQA